MHRSVKFATALVAASLVIGGCAEMGRAVDQAVQQSLTGNTPQDRIRRGDYDLLVTTGQFGFDDVCVHAVPGSAGGDYDPKVAVRILDRHTGRYGILPYDCAKAAAIGQLTRRPLVDAGTETAAAAFNDKSPCSSVPPELQPKYQRSCRSFDPKDPCSALPADGTWRNGQTTLAAACDARRAEDTIDRVNAYKPAAR
ncbi:MAG: hypothetical protein JSR59_07425 [Proteobacteria bacterium]|nr:hypothetical protein [Pseudomonadota bacterium]